MQEHDRSRLDAVENLAHDLIAEQQLVAPLSRIVANDIVAIGHGIRLAAAAQVADDFDRDRDGAGNRKRDQ